MNEVYISNIFIIFDLIDAILLLSYVVIVHGNSKNLHTFGIGLGTWEGIGL